MQAADGRFKHVRTGNARPQLAAPAGSGGLGDGPKALAAPGASASAGAILAVACPVVAYPQGTADLCATYGLASAVHEFGDASGAATIAACARAALKVSVGLEHLFRGSCPRVSQPASVLAAAPRTTRQSREPSKPSLRWRSGGIQTAHVRAVW